MGRNPTAVPLFNSQTPAAPAGYYNVKWQTDGGVPVQKITASALNYGNVNVISVQNYFILASDGGKLIVWTHNTPGHHGSIALPHPPPFPQWTVSVSNLSTNNYLQVSAQSGDTIDGSTDPVPMILDGGITFFTDGTNYFSVRGDRVNTFPYHVISFLPGVPPVGLQVLQWTCPADLFIWQGVTFYPDFAGSKGLCQTIPASSATYNVFKTTVLGAATQIGTIIIASTTGAYTFNTTSHVSYNFAPGDTLSVFAPSPQDLTLAGVGFTLVGFR